MTIRKRIIRDPQKFNNIAWGLLIFTSVVLIISVDFLMQAFSEERFVLSREAEFREIGNKLTKSVEFLSKQSRRYVVTLDHQDYKLYFDEINIKKSRENVIARLKKLNAKPNELKQLQEAKVLSDEIAKIEKLSMYLALPESYQKKIPKESIPEKYSQKNYKERLNHARELVFNKKYEDQKQDILVKILEYQKLITERMTLDASTANNYTSKIMLTVITLSTLIIVLVMVLIWIKTIIRKAK